MLPDLFPRKEKANTKFIKHDGSTQRSIPQRSRLLNPTIRIHGHISAAQISTIANITSSDTVSTHLVLSSDHGSPEHESNKNGEIKVCSIGSLTINLFPSYSIQRHSGQLSCPNFAYPTPGLIQDNGWESSGRSGPTECLI